MDDDELRYTTIEARWADRLAAIERAAFPTADPADLYGAPELRALAAEFPEGNFVVLDGDEPVAMGLGIRRDFDFSRPQHTIHDIIPTDGGTGHDPHGEWYYGTDISVHPRYRRRGIGRRLYELRKHCCRELGLRGIIAGGVLPGYADHKSDLSAADYVARVVAGEFYDPTLTFQIENGFEVRGVLRDYIHDPATDSWASLIVWPNPDHHEEA